MLFDLSALCEFVGTLVFVMSGLFFAISIACGIRTRG